MSFEVLLAFDKFKGSLSATDACAVAAEVVRQWSPTAHAVTAPLTDGGEGFVQLLTGAAEGDVRHCQVSGPLGSPVGASFGLVEIGRLPNEVRRLLDLPPEGILAVVEMAQATGLQIVPLPDRNPWKTTSFGTGEILRIAAQAQPVAILLGVGGSATHDLGLGSLQALGLRGNSPSPSDSLLPINWSLLKGFNGVISSPMPPLWIASDVENPLLGTRGAAAVFAPQKGLAASDLDRLESQTARVAELLCQQFEQDPAILAEPGSGAAGGIAVGLRCAFQARMISGFSLVRAWLELDQKLARADLIFTGEGCFDESSLEGKGPGFVLTCATEQGKDCWVLAGRINLPPRAMEKYPTTRFSEISPRDCPAEHAMARGAEFLRQATQKALNLT
jgi:glycerate 2-kinase